MATNSRGNGFFYNALEAMIAAREKQANRYVANAMLRFDDETLRAQGFTRAELKKRAAGYHPF